MADFGILNACKVPVCVLSVDGKIQFINTQLVELLKGNSMPEIGSYLSRFFRLSSQELLAGTTIQGWHQQKSFQISIESTAFDQEQYRVLTVIDITPEESLDAELKRMNQEIASGVIDVQLSLLESDGIEAKFAEQVNQSLTQLQKNIEHISRAIELMSECDFRMELDAQEKLQGTFGALQVQLSNTVSNLTESIRQTISSSETIDVSTQKIMAQNKILAEHIAEQNREIHRTSASMEELSSTVASTSQSAEKANAQGEKSAQLAEQGRTAVSEVLDAMDLINDSSREITDIVEIITGIAFQTNVLALNAAVEAARAGEYGKSFSIVASEVRSLASRSSDAANQIKKIIDHSNEIIIKGRLLAEDADIHMQSILEGVHQTRDQIQAIAKAAREQKAGIEDANQALTSIDHISQSNEQQITSIADNTRELELQTKFLKDAAGVFFLPDNELSHELHVMAKMDAVMTAKAVGKAFEKLIATGRITRESLFDYSYQPIRNTQPEKYSTPYDQLCDEILPSLQEPVLHKHSAYVYVITADFNGYVPTHNNNFCQPLTGDPARDLAGNRTKRIFDDRVGALVGRHTQPYKLQTYRRDTGELMFDMSVPVYVYGAHWGGIRIGYRITQ